MTEPLDIQPSEDDTRVPANVTAIGWTSFLTDISSEMVNPVIPLFLANALHAPVAAVGLIESVAEATASILRVFSGWLSDRMGKRKPLAALGYSMSNVAKPLLAIAYTWPQVFLLRWADKFGKGIRVAPRDALIADSSNLAQRGRNFGVHRAFDAAGAVAGPVFAAWVLWKYTGGYRIVFAASAVPAVFSMFVLFYFVRDKGGAKPKAADIPPPLSFKHLGKPFALFTVAATVFALGNSADALLILRAQNLGMPVPLIPLAYALFAVVGASLAIWAGSVSDRRGRRNVLTWGFLGQAVIYAGFAAATKAWQPWVLFALYGVPYAFTESLGRAYVVDLVPAGVRGSALGAFTFVLGLAALPASLVAGLIWDRFGPAAAFWVDAGIMAVAAVALFAMWRVLPRGDRHGQAAT